MTDQVNEAVSTPSEAVYAFGALLTTLSGSLTIGATHDASVMAQMCEAFRLANGWEPPRDNYTDYLARTSLDHLLPEAAHPARGVVDEAMVERIEAVRQGAIRAWEKEVGVLVSMNRQEACRVGMRAALQAAQPAVPSVSEEAPLTATMLADALGCFWNAALGSQSVQYDSTARAVAGAMVEGLAAVECRLREIAATPKDQPAQGVG